LARLMVANATFLSSVYLATGLVVELMRQHTRWRWVERFSAALDALPIRALEWVDLLTPVVSWYAHGTLNAFWMRAVLGLTTIVIIFAMAIFVGGGMWIAREAYERSRHVGG